LTHIQRWYEGTASSEDRPELPILSQILSRMLSHISEGSMNLEFSRRLIQRTSAHNTLIYDIASLSSYSQNISLLEYGYNRDSLDLPQINLSLIVDKELSIPERIGVKKGFDL
jgi:transposase